MCTIGAIGAATGGTITAVDIGMAPVAPAPLAPEADKGYAFTNLRSFGSRRVREVTQLGMAGWSLLPKPWPTLSRLVSLLFLAIHRL